MFVCATNKCSLQEINNPCAAAMYVSLNIKPIRSIAFKMKPRHWLSALTATIRNILIWALHYESYLMLSVNTSNIAIFANGECLYHFLFIFLNCLYRLQTFKLLYILWNYTKMHYMAMNYTKINTSKQLINQFYIQN